MLYMVASHTTRSDVLCYKMLYMVASDTTRSDVLCYKMLYTVASCNYILLITLTIFDPKLLSLRKFKKYI